MYFNVVRIHTNTNYQCHKYLQYQIDRMAINMHKEILCLGYLHVGLYVLKMEIIFWLCRCRHVGLLHLYGMV